jgi:hypothetical protein
MGLAPKKWPTDHVSDVPACRIAESAKRAELQFVAPTLMQEAI